PFDVLLSKPGAFTSSFKELYDERIHILSESLGYEIFPSPTEVFIYENKRYLSFWLKANNIPHPKTFVSYHAAETQSFLDATSYPIVAKTNIGASGSGVVVLKSKVEAEAYAKNVFSGRGAAKRTGPDLKKGNYIGRLFNLLKSPGRLRKKLAQYSELSKDKQTTFVIFQEYVPHTFEWRVVRIGESFFAHKKLMSGEKASGSLLKNYDAPPLDLFDFAKAITDKHKLFSQALDIFESDRGYLINEMQCIFGQSDPYQMLVNGQPGRYQHVNGSWQFEPGDFNTHESYDLRIAHLINSRG
ncbi:MAG: RimK family alpha-L-glutamate ligase, partial [Flavobacteriales bacterium]